MQPGPPPGQASDSCHQASPAPGNPSASRHLPLEACILSPQRQAAAVTPHLLTEPLPEAFRPPLEAVFPLLLTAPLVVTA